MNLFDAGDHVLAGVSGGVDSMVMLYILQEMREGTGTILSVAHINHGLRGRESDDDEAFVRNYCAGAGIAFYGKRWKGGQSAENIQDAARRFRFAAFSEIAAKIGAGIVALAHNMDDQAETVILNMVRGSSPHGLAGMAAERELKEGIRLVRPLLSLTRGEIERVAQEKGIEFRHDSTNDEDKYSRNFIRHRIMPALHRINPHAALHISKIAEMLKLDDDFIEGRASEIFGQIATAGGKNRCTLAQPDYARLEKPLRQRILKRAFAILKGGKEGLGSDHISKMDEIACGPKKGGEYNLPGSIGFKRKNGRLAFFKK